jgi:transcriptional regulator with XRE-family HTH domain
LTLITGRGQGTRLKLGVFKLDNDMTDASTGNKIHSRRVQMEITRGELAGVIDLEEADIDSIENGESELSADDLHAIGSYLCFEDTYLSGQQSLSDLMQRDAADTEAMVVKMTAAFRGLRNQIDRRIACAEIEDLLAGGNNELTSAV